MYLCPDVQRRKRRRISRPTVRARVVRLVRIGVAIAIFCIGWALPGHPQQTEPPRGEQAVEVHLQIIPFYAVSKDGRPVYDLQPDEVEILVDGKPYPLGHLDRYTFPPREERRQEQPPAAGSSTTSTGSAPAPSATTPAARPLRATPRQVILFFDLAFMTPRGFKETKKIALKVVDQLLDSDYVYFLTFSGTRGLRQHWGPISGRERVRQQVLRTLYRARAANVAPSPTVPFPGVPQRDEEPGDVLAELEDQVRNAQAFNRWTYQEVARRLAKVFDYLGSTLRPILGPKLLIYFSEGIRNSVYFGALYSEPSEQLVNPQAGQYMPRFFTEDNRYGTAFLHAEFRKALQKLAEAGVMFMVVHPEGYLLRADDPAGGENALRHMARSAYGLFLEGTNTDTIQRRIEVWTAAYYEAGIYLQQKKFKGKFRKVEVRIRRPGVKIWTVRGFREPRPYKKFSKDERLTYAVQLILRGVDNLLLRPAHARWYPLEGQPGGQVTLHERTLWVDINVPEEIRGDKVDIFSIVIAADEHGVPLRILKADARRQRIGRTDQYRLTAQIPWAGEFIWGVVIVDPDSGTTWWKRWRVHPP